MNLDEKYSLFTEGTEVSLKVKYLMSTQILVFCFCYIFDSKFISLINIRIFHERTKKLFGYYIVTGIHVKTCAILLSLFTKFPHLKYHFQPIFKLRAEALCQYFVFLHYLMNIHYQTTVIHRRLQSL